MNFNDKQLIILMGGKSSRLYPLTMGFPKGLLSVKQKPFIYNMIVPLIKKGLKEIILVVNKENEMMIRDFLNESFCNIDININYIIQNDFSGPGKALEITKDYINESKSTLLLLSDTFCCYPKNYNNSWIGTSKVKDEELYKYCIIKNKNNVITEIIDKPTTNIDSNDAAVGIYFFKNSKLLKKVLNTKIEKIKGEYQLSSYFEEYRKKEPLLIENIDNWQDIGTLEGYSKTNKNSFNCRFYNNITLDEFGVLSKKSDNESISSEIKWFKQIENTNFSKITPKLFDVDETENKYGIEFYDYLTLSEYYTFYPLTYYSKEYIFKNLIDKLFKIYDTNKIKNMNFKNYTKEILMNKTISRLKEWNYEELKNKKVIYINNEKYLGILPLLEKLEKRLNHIIETTNDFISIIHGDPCFVNILFSPRNMIYKFIDPRGNFGKDTIYGDYRYDLAKIRHSYHGRYDEIINDLFEVKKEDNNKYNILFYKNINYSYYDLYLKNKGINIDDIELIEGLLFISMIPLHEDYPDRQLAFFLQGIKILNNQLGRRESN